MNRPDFSMHLAHFTKDGQFCHEAQNEEVAPFQQMNAKQRLESILQQKKIYTTNMPWTGLPCVCFTECPWSSLLAHTEKYSPYGIGFSKEFIFNKGGAPALYMRVNIFEKLRKKPVKSKEETEMWTFVTPFSPKYGNKYTRSLLKTWVDFSQEREWRTPNALEFNYSNIEFIVLKGIEDYDTLSGDIRNSLKEAKVKIIIMDNYRMIEELWPVHKIN